MSSSLGVSETLSHTSTGFVASVVGFFFTFRLFIMLLSVRVFGTDPQTGVEATLALNFLLLVAVAFYSLGEVHCSLGSMSRLPSVRWVLFFLLFSGCSFAWSSTASLPAATAYWCAMAADVAIVALLLRGSPARDVTDSLMKGAVWGACCVASIAWIMPAQSDLRLGDEELLGPNAIGYTCAFAVFLAEYLIATRRGQRRWKFLALFLAATTLRSLSKTTIVAFLVSQAFILSLDRSVSRKTKVALLAGFALLIAVSWGLLQAYYDIYVNAGYQVETLTGRLGIWAYILNEALDKPWIGHGFHSVWKVIPPFGSDRFEARHAHNELLQQFYTYGVVGIVMLIGLYRSFYNQAKKLPKSSLRTLLFGLMVFVVVRGFGDTEVFDLSLPTWLIVLFSVFITEFTNNCWKSAAETRYAINVNEGAGRHEP
jgi:exopolysaccharide production protein ExoQ